MDFLRRLHRLLSSVLREVRCAQGFGEGARQAERQAALVGMATVRGSWEKWHANGERRAI